MVLPDLPAARAIAAFVEPVKAVGQVRSEFQLDLVLPAFGQNGVGEQGQLMETRVLQHHEGPRAIGTQQQHVGHLQPLGVENHGAGVFEHVQTDPNNAGEVERGEVWVEGEVVVQGADSSGKPHSVPREGLTIGGNEGVLGLALVWDLSSR